MARKRRGAGPQPEPGNPAEGTEATIGDDEELELVESDSPEDEDEPVLRGYDLSFDRAASERAVAACAGIFSAAETAVSEATQAAAPFLGFGQRARIRALATDFETRRSAIPLAAAPAAPSKVEGAAAVQQPAIAREDVEAIVAHRVTLLVQDALRNLGVSPDSSIAAQVERQVEIQLSSQEHKLLEYVKRHLTDSLEMLETTLDERIAEFLEGQEQERASAEKEAEEAKAEVEAKVAEARENLLKSIEEVRTVDLGFSITDFAAGIQDVVSGNMKAIVSGSMRAVSDQDLKKGTPEAPVEVAGEIGEEAEIVEGFDEGDEGEEVAAAEEESSTEGAETVATGREDEVLGEIEGGVEEISVIDESRPVRETEIDLDEGETSGLRAMEDEVRPDSDEAAELDSALEIDIEEADADDDDDDVGLDTLGHGPDDLQVAPVRPAAADYEMEIAEEGEGDELAAEGEAVSAEDRQRNVERYLQRAVEMRNRKQLLAAMELYSKVLDIDADNYEARIGRGVLHLEGRDFKRAVDEFTRAEAVDPSRPAAALGLAEVHFHRKQFNKAIRHYTQCLKLDDRLAQAYCNRGLSYYYQKNYKKAFLDLMRAYDIDPQLPHIKKYLKLVRNKVKDEKGGGAPADGDDDAAE